MNCDITISFDRFLPLRDQQDSGMIATLCCICVGIPACLHILQRFGIRSSLPSFYFRTVSLLVFAATI